MGLISRHKLITFLVLVAAIIMLAAGLMLKQEAEAAAADQAKSIRQAVYDRALQCYVIEGAYPASLSYLEEKYGLAVNHKAYIVEYSAYAENQPPEIRVIAREQEKS
jgi:CDP-diacylglycerol pyrophosphatase